jgi:toxin ParE1/3/4
MVRWSGPARMDLKQIHDYIAKDSRYYAKNVVQRIVEKAEELVDFPEIGRIVPEMDEYDLETAKVMLRGKRLLGQRSMEKGGMEWV